MNIDFGKALNLLDGDPKKIIHAAEEKFDGIEWEEKSISRRRQMPGGLAQDESANSEVFYATVDSVIAGINERFSSS